MLSKQEHSLPSWLLVLQYSLGLDRRKAASLLNHVSTIHSYAVVVNAEFTYITHPPKGYQS